MHACLPLTVVLSLNASNCVETRFEHAGMKRQRVDAVITALGLDKCRGTLVGGPMRRGVSGGERKRVSVGHELLIDPSVLILDEPTSGLDSTTAMHLMSTLRALASGGRTVITTIHQPSSRLYRQLDNLILMSDGHVMYSGRASEAATWFGHLGCTLPYGVNVADFVLDLASGEFENDGPVLGTQGRDRKERLIEARLRSASPSVPVSLHLLLLLCQAEMPVIPDVSHHSTLVLQVCEEFVQMHDDGFLGEADVPHIPGIPADSSQAVASARRHAIDEVKPTPGTERTGSRCALSQSAL